MKSFLKKGSFPECVIPQSSPRQDVTFVSSETFSKIPPSLCYPHPLSYFLSQTQACLPFTPSVTNGVWSPPPSPPSPPSASVLDRKASLQRHHLVAHTAPEPWICHGHALHNEKNQRLFQKPFLTTSDFCPE